ncbi:MAG: c-type cytochrome [Gammaproteobacteria bacterium]|nr:c-type cytochrome [Gammaproteobacteria bacterium]MDX2487281.1 c-type cytochrome [Gammaproteobacteria bacterium]
MMRLITVFIGMAVLVPLANAEPSSAVAFDLPTIKLLRSADPANGEALAKESKCSKCHGDAGVSDDPDDVNIAGMSSSYLFKQLKDYQDKKRDDRDMYKKVKALDDKQLADLSAWYASLEPAKAGENKTVTPEIQKLITHGDPERLLKACAACHGRKGRGGQFDHPALAGQNKTYLVDSMVAFKDEDRTNDIYSRMRTVSEVLTEEEIEALADYYAADLPEE